jgi:uroporphyrinogen III methyltransferase/synthase
MLEQVGACPAARPTVAFETPADPEPVRQAIASLSNYDWLVFTSHNGVAYFFSALNAGRDVETMIPGRIAAIGPATAATLVRRGVTVDLISEESRSEGLAAGLCDSIGSGQRVLLIKPEKARDILEKAVRGRGSELDAVAFYRNVPAPGIDDLVNAIINGRYQMAVFSSPSTFTNLYTGPLVEVATLIAALNRMAVVAIGPVTAEALKTAGVNRVTSAAVTTDEGILDALRVAKLPAV